MMTSPQTTPDGLIPDEDEGLQKGLSTRQINMIAIGSAIGTGLFLGTASRLETAGPSLAFMYLLCGFIGYLILRSLGELIVHRPTSGSFVSYTREFFGEKAAFFSGWLYWFNWAATAVADATALAIYIRWFGQYSDAINQIPQWLIALCVIVLVSGLNLVSVKFFGEMEFWFSLIKVLFLLTFLIVGTYMVIHGMPDGAPTGISLISENGGWFPRGVVPSLLVIQGVVFAFAGIELLGTTSGEAEHPKEDIPRAINAVVFRLLVFYFGSVLLLCLLMPYTDYSADESPFVTFFSSIGVPAAGAITQLVVITAALSSLNAGLYSTGRIVYSLSKSGSAPAWAGRTSRTGVPYGGILLTTGVALCGVVLNYFVPEQAFEVVLNIAALGTMASWAAISLSHMRFVRLAKQGKYERPSYRAPLSPATDVISLAFLAFVLVLMALDYPVGTWTLIASVLMSPLLIIGWFRVRDRVEFISRTHATYEEVTGEKAPDLAPPRVSPPPGKRQSGSTVWRGGAAKKR